MRDEIKLPKGWQRKKLGAICGIVYGKGLPVKQLKPSGFPVFGANGIIGFNDKYLFEEPQVLISCRGAASGKINLSPPKCYVTNNSLVLDIKKKDEVDKNYLFFALSIAKKTKLVTGTAQPQVTINNAVELDIPFPPLPEQQAIVSKIEELFSELDNGITLLKTAQQQLKVYRQSLLKWAFEGKITNKKVKDGELPKGWNLNALGDVSEMCLGKMLDKKKNKGNYLPYLRNISVRWGHFDLSDLEEMRFETYEEERYSLKNGDLIICEGGEPGRCAIWKSVVPNMKIQKALHRVRVKNMVSEIYLYHYIFYATMAGLLKKHFTGTTIKHLTGRELKKIEIPLPSIKEQNFIVSELESKLTVCDKIEETISQSLQQAETLRQSILKQAFEGKLVKMKH